MAGKAPVKKSTQKSVGECQKAKATELDLIEQKLSYQFTLLQSMNSRMIDALLRMGAPHPVADTATTACLAQGGGLLKFEPEHSLGRIKERLIDIETQLKIYSTLCERIEMVV